MKHRDNNKKGRSSNLTSKNSSWINKVNSIIDKNSN